MTSDLDGIYRVRPITLWVEDTLTREYFKNVSDAGDAITFLVAGGADGVRAVVRDARASGANNVFGYRDRDFAARRPILEGSTQREVFVTEVHEIENLVLDPASLAACELNTAGSGADQIAEQAHEIASTMTAWVALCHVHADLRRAGMEGFPPVESPQRVTTLEDAVELLASSTWVTTTAPGLGEVLERSAIRAKLDAAMNEARSQLSNGAWRFEFPGKEILRQLAPRVHPRTTKQKDRLRDLVLAVARQQIASETVPTEIRNLVAHLRGLARPPAA